MMNVSLEERNKNNISADRIQKGANYNEKRENRRKESLRDEF